MTVEAGAEGLVAFTAVDEVVAGEEGKFGIVKTQKIWWVSFNHYHYETELRLTFKWIDGPKDLYKIILIYRANSMHYPI